MTCVSIVQQAQQHDMTDEIHLFQFCFFFNLCVTVIGIDKSKTLHIWSWKELSQAIHQF